MKKQITRILGLFLIKMKFLYFILFFFSSCSVISKKISNEKMLIGRIMMHGTKYPLSVNVNIYKNEKKIISIKSDKEGYFHFPYHNTYRNGLTFITLNKEVPDKIHNVNGYAYILYNCFSSDTINLVNVTINDTIILSAKKCKLMIIPDKPHREH